MHGHLQVVLRPEDALSEEAFSIGVIHGLLHPAGGLGVLTSDVDEGVVDLVGDGSDDHAFDQLVRVALEELAILKGAWFGFVTVDN